MANNQPQVEVLLSAFNGEKFLRGQLDSILNQSFRDWRLLARDDGSRDATPSILAEYAAREPGRIVVLKDEDNNIGISASFSRLMSRSSAGHLMFSDQDDIWLPQKMELTLRNMQELEQIYGVQTPLLVHSDMKVIGEDARPVADSFWNYQHLRPEIGQKWTRLLVQNTVTGCAMMVNRALNNLALPIPEEAIIHDWWLALAAAAFGRIRALPDKTALYRQHGGNAVGAKEWNLGFIVRRAGEVFKRRWTKKESLLAPSIRQSRAFLARYEGRLDQRAGDILRGYHGLKSMGVFRQRIFLAQNEILKTGWIRNIGLFLEI